MDVHVISVGDLKKLIKKYPANTLIDLEGIDALVSCLSFRWSEKHKKLYAYVDDLTIEDRSRQNELEV